MSRSLALSIAGVVSMLIVVALVTGPGPVAGAAAPTAGMPIAAGAAAGGVHAAALAGMLGPHPHPLPGAVVEKFPAKVHAWHSRGNDEAGNEILLHGSSHIYLVGPDGNWVDGMVHVGEAVYFHADFPSKLPAGKYKVKSTARWIDKEYEPEFEWEFTVKQAGDPEADEH